MQEFAPAASTLFSQATSKTSTGSSLVLLTAAIGETPSPRLFEEIAPGRPQNYAVVQDMVIIDFNTIQCLVLPGEPLRLQVQWTEARAPREATEFARRFFRVALAPRLLGLNTGYRFDFGEPALGRIGLFLNQTAVHQLIDSDLIHAGVKLKVQREAWRTLLTLDPGLTPSQINWQINFERDASSLEQVNTGLDAVEQLTRDADALLRRLHWTD